MKNVIGVDLGGTNVRAGLVSGQKLIKMAESHLGPGKNRKQVLERLYNVIEQVIDKNTGLSASVFPASSIPKKGLFTML